jgi:hypothetical protein
LSLELYQLSEARVSTLTRTSATSLASLFEVSSASSAQRLVSSPYLSDLEIEHSRESDSNYLVNVFSMGRESQFWLTVIRYSASTTVRGELSKVLRPGCYVAKASDARHHPLDYYCVNRQLSQKRSQVSK